MSGVRSDSRDKVACRESFTETPPAPVDRAFGFKTLHRVVRSVRTFKRELAGAQHRAAGCAPAARRPKLGLALGGGFARAIAHIGVLKVLDEEKIPIDFVAGTSAGAIIGAAYCGGKSAKELEELAGKGRFGDFARWGLSRYGFFTSDRMVDFWARVVKLQKFEDLKIPFAVIATDVRTGAAVVFTKGPLVDSVRASCAYPGMFPPVDVDGRLLIDGMLAYAVPTTPLHEMGADCVLGVHLHAPWSQQAGPRNLFQLIGRCFSIAEAKLCEQWKKDADFVLELDVDGFAIDCFARAKELIAKGEQAARAALPELRRLLNLWSERST
jgi:NTE family protein